MKKQSKQPRNRGGAETGEPSEEEQRSCRNRGTIRGGTEELLKQSKQPRNRGVAETGEPSIRSEEQRSCRNRGTMDLSLAQQPQPSSSSQNYDHFLSSRLASAASAQHLDSAEHPFLPYPLGPYLHPLSTPAAFPTLSTFITADVASQHYPLYGYGADSLASAPVRPSIASWTSDQYRMHWTNPWEHSIPPAVSPNSAPYAVGSDLAPSFGHDFRILGVEARDLETKTPAMPDPPKKRSHKASERNKLSVKSVRAKIANPSSPGWCSICQRNCVTEVALRQHLDGKAHKKQVERQKLTEDAVLKSSNEDGKGAANILENMWLQMSMIAKPARTTRKKITAAVAPPEVMKTKESLRCDICDVECNNETILAIHFGGRKHAARLKKLQQGTVIACNVSQIPSMTHVKILPQISEASQDGTA